MNDDDFEDANEYFGLINTHNQVAISNNQFNQPIVYNNQNFNQVSKKFQYNENITDFIKELYKCINRSTGCKNYSVNDNNDGVFRFILKPTSDINATFLLNDLYRLGNKFHINSIPIIVFSPHSMNGNVGTNLHITITYDFKISTNNFHQNSTPIITNGFKNNENDNTLVLYSKNNDNFIEQSNKKRKFNHEKKKEKSEKKSIFSFGLGKK